MKKVLAGLAIVVWIVALLTFVVVVRDLVTGIRAEPNSYIRAYNFAVLIHDGIFSGVLLAVAIFLTRSYFDNTKVQIALVLGFLVAIGLGINASYAVYR